MLNSLECTSAFAQDIDSLLSMSANRERGLTKVFDKISGDRLDDDTSRPGSVDLPFTGLAYLRRYAKNYLHYKSWDYENLARTVTHPCFVMCGELDAQTNIASAKRIIESLSNATLPIDPKADHYGILREESDTIVTIWNYLYDQRTAAA